MSEEEASSIASTEEPIEDKKTTADGGVPQGAVTEEQAKEAEASGKAESSQDVAEKHELVINFVDFIPTAENIAKYFFDILQPNLTAKGINLFSVRLWETPTSSAYYTIHNRLEDRKSITLGSMKLK